MQHLWRPRALKGGVGPLRAIKHNGPDATVVLVEMWTLNANSLVRSEDFVVLYMWVWRYFYLVCVCFLDN